MARGALNADLVFTWIFVFLFGVAFWFGVVWALVLLAKALLPW